MSVLVHVSVTVCNICLIICNICVPVRGSEAQVYSLEECVVDAVNQHNKLAASTDT